MPSMTLSRLRTTTLRFSATAALVTIGISNKVGIVATKQLQDLMLIVCCTLVAAVGMILIRLWLNCGTVFA